MIELLAIIAGLIFVWVVKKIDRSKTTICDPRSTVGHGPDQWLNDQSPLTCPDCEYKSEAKNFFQKTTLKHNFICPQCKTHFEIR